MSAAEELLHLARRATPNGSVYEDAHAPFIDSEFAHRIAHDIRSPLTVIQMCAETLLDDEDGRLRTKYCSIILGQTRSLAWRLEDLVTLADEDSWTHCERVPLHLGQLVREAVADLDVLFAARPLHLPADVGASQYRARVARAAMQQAVRCCVLALLQVASSPQDAVCVSLHDASDSAVAPGHVAVRMMLSPADPPSRPGLRAPSLPWDHLSLMAAVRVVGAHGGLLSEIPADGSVGVQIMIPTGSSVA